MRNGSLDRAQSVEQLDAFPRSGEEDRTLGSAVKEAVKKVGNLRNRFFMRDHIALWLE
jgi:hypothetical protein